MNERVSLLYSLPMGTSSNTTTNFVNVQVESYASPQQIGRNYGSSSFIGKPREYNYTYKVTITHTGPQDSDPFHLKFRHLKITNENGESKILEGNGVFGKCPELRAGQMYSYSATCSLATPVGVLEGHFVMVDPSRGSYEAKITPIRLDASNFPTKEQGEEIEATEQSMMSPVYASPDRAVE